MKVLQSKLNRPLSDLEGATLAALAQHGEATSYQLANDFKSSPSEFWSGSAGAIYPLMARLADLGLVEGKAGRKGTRARVLWSLSKRGYEAMLTWLTDVERASGMGFDPLRTRMVHLNLMPEAKRATFLASIADKTKGKKVVQFPSDSPALQALHESWIFARLAWLDQLEGLVVLLSPTNDSAR
jgi:DNA-binding PadR family transcriptional regulator